MMQRDVLQGPVGPIEVLVDAPVDTLRGVAVIAHPQPLLGGSAAHKIPHLLARACRDLGWLALRPNFRGVGQTAGQYDAGVGETDDVLAVIAWSETRDPGLPLTLVGFSFGAFVQARVAARLVALGIVPRHVFLAGLPVGTVEGGRSYELNAALPARSVVVHGERDAQVPLSAVLRWAGDHAQPVTVIPGADHFFTGKLASLRGLLESELRRVE